MPVLIDQWRKSGLHKLSNRVRNFAKQDDDKEVKRKTYSIVHQIKKRFRMRDTDF